MMIKKGSLSILVLCAALASSALAVPNISGTESVIESNPIDESSGNWDFDWSYVYGFRESSAVAVDSYWILTAAHVADDTWASGSFTVGGVTYTAVETNYYNGTISGSSSVSDVTADLALVRVDKALPGYYDYAASVNTYNHDDVILVGYGRTGEVFQTSSATGYWTSVTGDNAQRWGTNNIDGVTSVEDAFGNTYNMYVTTISSTSSLSNTDYETGVNVSDSGGGMFALNGSGEWILVGINAYQSGSDGEYTAALTVPVGNYSDWIANVTLVPEPSTVALMAVGATAVIFIRRKKIK